MSLQKLDDETAHNNKKQILGEEDEERCQKEPREGEKKGKGKQREGKVINANFIIDFTI